MEQRANFLDEGIDQVKEAWSSVEDEFGKLQKNLERRRKRFEKETQKQVRRFERTSFGKRVTTLREDTQKQIESNIESLLALFPIASRADVKRLERKVATLTRKVTTLEKANGKTKTASRATEGSRRADKTEARASA